MDIYEYNRVKDQLVEASEEIEGKKKVMTEAASVMAKFLKENKANMKAEDVTSFMNQIYNLTVG